MFLAPIRSRSTCSAAVLTLRMSIISVSTGIFSSSATLRSIFRPFSFSPWNW